VREITTCTPEETQAIGEALAARLQPGDTLLLEGDLGAGKTVFARGVARGLGIMDAITSPTFTLLHAYQGRLPLYHMDLYRLDGDEAFYQAGLEEYIGGDGVALVEWPTCCPGAMPARCLRITIAYGAQEGERLLTLTPQGGFPEEEAE
jgi:tRNA threonylcarbamoyladenosine biosynthesis protein TsaE